MQFISRRNLISLRFQKTGVCKQAAACFLRSPSTALNGRTIFFNLETFQWI